MFYCALRGAPNQGKDRGAGWAIYLRPKGGGEVWREKTTFLHLQKNP